MIKVSVVIPVYNTEKYIEQCLESLMNQTLKEIEIICVDDGSKDRSVELIHDFCKKDGRISLLLQENSYAGVARNNGLKHAKGKYVIFLDSDDFFEPDMLLSMYEKAEKDRAQICLCSGRTFNEKTGEYIKARHYLNTDFLPQETPFSPMDINRRIFNAISPAPWSKLFRKDFVEKQGIAFQPLKKTNDLFFVYTSLACAERITYIDMPFVNYRIENSSSLQGTTAELSTDFYNALFALKKELQRRKLFTRYEQSFANRALSTCLYVLNRITDQENYETVLKLLRDSFFYNLSVLGHSRGYFYNKSDYDKLISVLECNSEELWNSQFTDSDIKATDLKNWECPFEIVDDGKIKVSVIIPVYNVEKYLRECIDSVINNTLTDIEIICVDDGSTDNSSQILKEYAHKESRIVVIHKENGGLSSARNAGMDVAQGEYILFLDSDDYIEPRALEYLYAESKKDNLDQMFFGAKSFYDYGNGIKNKYNNYDSYYTRKAAYDGVMTGRKMFAIMSENAEYKPSACLQINKRVFLNENKIRFIEGIIYEDNPFTLECLSLSQRVRYENINLYNRRLRENSIITTSSGAISSFNYYVIVKAFEKLALKYNFNSDKVFYRAFLLQLERVYKSSRNFVKDLSNNELLDYICALDEDTGTDYFVMLSRNWNVTAETENKDIAEKALMDRHFERCRKLNSAPLQKSKPSFAQRLKRKAKAIVKIS